MNDSEREDWINNDEGLYLWWKSSKQSITKFIRENREELTQIIQATITSKPRAKQWYDYQ